MLSPELAREGAPGESEACGIAWVPKPSDDPIIRIRVGTLECKTEHGSKSRFGEASWADMLWGKVLGEVFKPQSPDNSQNQTHKSRKSENLQSCMSRVPGELEK
jgi:hypothetical protein